jgi:dTDP-4-amino-4,6-dideoxygalactose transaminase
MLIPFSLPARFDSELEYLGAARNQGKPWGGGDFYQAARDELLRLHPTQDALMTQSCTSALELAAIALNVGPGDEVIVPSYTFVSSANAFVLRGAKIVFADSRAADLNVDLDHVETLISERTKVLVVVHYGGVSCDMDRVMQLAETHGFYVVEDAAQAIGAHHNEKPLGTIGHLGAVSFHGTKNVSCGEGGALLINTEDSEIFERARMAHEKGTDRARFLSGQVDKYTWRTIGGSFIPSEFSMAVLKAQLESIDLIRERRAASYRAYRESLSELETTGVTFLAQDVPGANFHMFAMLLESRESREQLRGHLSTKGVIATSHYEPLHLSPYGEKNFASNTALGVATESSDRILRLPLWSHSGLPTDFIANLIVDFFRAGGHQE